MFSFDPQLYGPQCAELLEIAAAADSSGSPLGPGPPHAEARERLQSLDDAALFAGQQVRDPQMAACCRSGLWLLHNYLDESHRLSQDIQTRAGSYWHGIMHRREPDFSNAKYWFGRVGHFPTDPSLAEAARAIAQQQQAVDVLDALDLHSPDASWNAARFVDFCQAASQGDAARERVAREIARREWQLLFHHCYLEAVSE